MSLAVRSSAARREDRTARFHDLFLFCASFSLSSPNWQTAKEGELIMRAHEQAEQDSKEAAKLVDVSLSSLYLRSKS